MVHITLLLWRVVIQFLRGSFYSAMMLPCDMGGHMYCLYLLLEKVGEKNKRKQIILCAFAMYSTE